MAERIGPGVYDPGQEFAANHAPIAPYTWEVFGNLASTIQETGRIPIRWNRPVEILGFYPSVVDLTDQGLASATLDDLLVVLSANQQDRFTNRLEDTAVVGAADTFVTLGALAVQVPRLVRIQLRNAAPEMDISFRWKPNNVITAPIFNDVLIGLCFYCRYLEV